MNTHMIGTTMLLATLALSSPMHAAASETCDSPITVQGFQTCADVQKAETEGTLVVYSPNIEQGTVKLLQAFESAFPKIKTKYIRLQSGALYSKLMAERQAKSYLVDVLNMSDRGLAEDFLKRDGYQKYQSPQIPAYEPRFRSKPEGYFTAGTLIMVGIAYNPNNIAPEDVPKDWTDLNNPKWQGGISVKSANSGVQYTTWHELRDAYGEQYWEDFAKQKPRAFDSYVQQFDRIINGEDKFAHTAQYSGYLEFKKRGAPIAFVPPSTGLPVIPEVWGVVNQAPHPQAARLFMDWVLSAQGQTVMTEAFYVHSPRTDVAPPPGGIPLSEMTLLTPEPDDWEEYVRMRKDFVKEWGRLSGLR